ncbi:15070_t:CDS:2, partial [Cetraspora pellucida]
NKPIESCNIDMTKERTRKDFKVDSDSIDVNNKNIQLDMQVLIGYDDHVFSECDPNEPDNVISTKSRKHEQLKGIREKMNEECGVQATIDDGLLLAKQFKTDIAQIDGTIADSMADKINSIPIQNNFFCNDNIVASNMHQNDVKSQICVSIHSEKPMSDELRKGKFNIQISRNQNVAKNIENEISKEQPNDEHEKLLNNVQSFEGGELPNSVQNLNEHKANPEYNIINGSLNYVKDPELYEILDTYQCKAQYSKNDTDYVYQNSSKRLEPIDNKFATKIEESDKPSRTLPKTLKNLKVKRYNTRSADGTRKLRVMFDGVQAGNQKSKNDINSKQKKKSSSQKIDRNAKASTLVDTKETLKNTRSKTSIKMPTIPKGSFGYFFEDYYAKIKVSHPNESLTQVMKDAGVLWREMTERDKQIYRDRQNAARERYKNEMQRYKEKQTLTLQDKPKKSKKKATVVDFSGRPLFKDFDSSSSEETSYMDIELEKKSNKRVVVGTTRSSVRSTPKKEVVKEEPIILHHGQRMISQLKNIKKSDEPNLAEGSEER